MSGVSDLAGRVILITAGPTQEPIDPVRYLSNRSSGKMGYALAEAARRRGARVILISGPVSIAPPLGVELVAVTTAAEMHDAVLGRAKTCDALIMSAAVADYRVAHPSEHKLKREPDRGMTLELTPNPDILATVGRGRVPGEPPRVIVGFALETDALLTSARGKLQRKGCDLLVANLAAESIGRDESVAHILDAEGMVDSPGSLPKPALAERILDRVCEKLSRD